MTDWRARLLFCLVLWVAAWPGFSHAYGTKARFAALDIYLEADELVAAWAFELSEAGGRMDVVGVENGDSPAFARAPYYDRTAVAGRVIVRDFTRNRDEITVGRVRIATVHVRLTGDSDPDYVLRLVAATGPRLVGAPASLHLEVRSIPSTDW